MVHTSIMIASMAGEEQPVFHDFLGMACRNGGDMVKLEGLDASKVKEDHQGQGAETKEAAAKAAVTSSGHFDDPSPSTVVSGAEQSVWPHGSGGALQAASVPGLHKLELNNCHGKRRDSGDCLPQQFRRVVDIPEASPYLKVSRIKKSDDRKTGFVDIAPDFPLQPPMRPPWVSSNPQSSHPSFSVKLGLNTIVLNKLDTSKHVSSPSGMFRPAEMGLLSLQGDKVSLSNARDSSVIMPRPPADEGSRTGLKGSSGGILHNSPLTNPLPMPAYSKSSSGRLKLSSQSVGLESLSLASQQTTPTGRQLTIFYGGHAHVFDDVPSDKADAIMMLAGSSGRSWSTMYTPCSKASMLGSGSEGSQSIVDREKSISESSAMHGTGVNALDVSNVGFQSGAARPTENNEGSGMPSFSGSRGTPLMQSISAGEIRKELS